MAIQIQFVLFILIFLSLYSGIHYYVLNKISKVLGLDKDKWFYTLFVFLILSYIASNMLITSYDNIFTRGFYYISALWMGILFLLFTLFLVYDIIGIFHKLPLHQTGLVVIALVIVLTIYSIINAFTIRTPLINIASDKIDAPLSIVQISDVHIGPIHGESYLKAIVDKTNSLNPDIVVITGDLLDGRFDYDPKDFLVLNTLKAKTYFITGNHETYAGLELLENIFKDTNFTILRNELVTYKNIQIIGIDDADSTKQVAKELSNIKFDNSKYAILLYHRPPGFKDAAALGVDLMLCGHTHNGQIYPFNYLSALVNGPVRGLHKLNTSYLYVSEGTGTWGPPMRLGSISEITKITINPQMHD